jgi:dTDP-4-dehydrorhamnose reductase
MKVMLTGISGFLGFRLAEKLSTTMEICGVYNSVNPQLDLETAALDLTSTQGQIFDILDGMSPDFIIHTAAVSQPVKFSENPDYCRQVNLTGSAEIARWCSRNNRGLIFCSSDTVYPDASKRCAPDIGWSEDQDVDPENAYGLSKAEAEQAILQHFPEALVLRLSLMFGKTRPGRNSFSQWLLNRYDSGQDVPVFTDNRRNTISAGYVSLIIEQLLTAPQSGVMNVGCPEYLSREEFAKLLFTHLKLDPLKLKPCLTRDAGLKVALPLELPLNLNRLKDSMPFKLPETATAIAAEY